MMVSDAESYVIKKKWEFNRQGDELVITICPFCGDQKRRFNLNKLMGLWKCFDCERSGNLWQLKQHCGDIEEPSKVAKAFGGEVAYDVVPREEVNELVAQLWNDPSGLQWLYDRGIPDNLIKEYCLGITYDEQGRFITFPYFKDDKWVNIKYRSLPPLAKAFRVKPKHEKPLYNLIALKAYEDMIIVEGEIDCLSAIVMGFKNVVSLPQGANNFAPDHWDALVGCRYIYFILDSDGAGRAGVKKIAYRLGADRCYDVRIPGGYDVNDLLVNFNVDGGRKRLQACIEEAKPVGVGEVAGVRDALQELEDHIILRGSVETGFVSPWPSVNQMCGSIAPGEVLLIQAIPKTGKTTFCQQWLSWLAQTHNIPTMMYCLEMPLWRLAQSLVAGTTMTSRGSISTLQVKMTILQYRDTPFYYGAIPKQWDFEHIKDVIIYSVKRFGIQLVCFDNLQLLCRSKKDTWTEQAAVSKSFKQLASELDIAILLVVQPKKMDPRYMPGMYDPSGSGSIIADADGMLSLWRKPLHSSETAVSDDQLQTIEAESFGPETLVRVPASRYRPGGQALLYFDGPFATFTEPDRS